MMPVLNTSAATIVPIGRGTLEYASIICSEVAWKSNSRPVLPAASGESVSVRDATRQNDAYLQG